MFDSTSIAVTIFVIAYALIISEKVHRTIVGIFGAMLMIMSHFIREAKPRIWASDERMKRVLKHIHEHIADEIDVTELADVATVTKTYFIRIFKQEFAQTPVQYINRKKVERAQLLLFTSDCSVKEVAYKLGFSDHSYFIRLFRKIAGITPQEYRRQLGL